MTVLPKSSTSMLFFNLIDSLSQLCVFYWDWIVQFRVFMATTVFGVGVAADLGPSGQRPAARVSWRVWCKAGEKWEEAATQRQPAGLVTWRQTDTTAGGYGRWWHFFCCCKYNSAGGWYKHLPVEIGQHWWASIR
jgi:hypothetical protein